MRLHRARWPSWVAGLLACVLLSACQSYAPLSEAQAKRVDLRLQLASAYLERGQPDVALTEAKLAIELDPNNAQAHNVLAMALMGLQRNDAAQLAMHKATQLAPQDLSLQHNLAWLQCVAGKTDQAMATFQRLLSDAPSSFDTARTQLSLGVCALQAQQTETAQAALSQALLDQRYANAARFGLAKLMVQTADWPGAMRMLTAMPTAQRVTPAVQELQAEIDAQFERSKQTNTKQPLADVTTAPGTSVFQPTR